MFWTTTLATNYTNYQNNLKALEYYRRHILPDQVRYYRGVFERRQADPLVASLPPSDLVTAQQALTTNVQTYLGILGSLWSAVVSVADPLQTNDLFQMAERRELPELPDLDKLPRWLCPHHRQGAIPAPGAGNNCPPAVPAGKPAQLPDSEPVLPAPRKADESPALPPPAEQRPKAKAADLTQQLLQPPPDIPKKMRDEG
jgi:cobalt-zinc-cadmium efflux system outer membrane protein